MKIRAVDFFVGFVCCLLTAGAALAGTTAVPEPMSLSLFAGGIGALAIVRFLRKK